jgi:pyruvate formate lyase activating enzyme
MDRAMVVTKYWHRTGDGRVQCDVCPRACRLHEGQRGFCFVRMRQDDAIVLTTYGRSSGYCVDPIEKKPLNHFLPGSPVLSFGTAGCNLGCRFCQNWDISKSREIDTLADAASPEAIAEAAADLGCRSVAFTYNDPVIFLEYAIDVADACRERGIKAVAVTAGYMSAEPRAEFCRHIDAANVDLKGFTGDFYRRVCLVLQSRFVMWRLMQVRPSCVPGSGGSGRGPGVFAATGTRRSRAVGRRRSWAWWPGAGGGGFRGR